MRIAIIVPSPDMVHTDFAMSLTNMVTYTSMQQRYQLGIINPRSSLVQKGRWDGVRQALELGADKILFIDSDQTFPPDALVRLLHRDKDIVGATYRLRHEEVEYTARDAHGDRIDFSQREGLHQVASNGLGFTLIDTEVFKKLPQPWFNVSMIDGRWISEDESFFHDAENEGYKVWVDADLTKEVGHVGIKCYS